MRNPEAAGFSDNLPDGHVYEDEVAPRADPVANVIAMQDDVVGHDITLSLIQQTLSDSETYLNGEVRAQIDRNHSNFKSKHPDGSKYYSKAYAHRSRLYKPATRSAAQRAEAACSAAFFSTQDATHIEADDQDDPELAAAARIWHKALEYRLRETMHWKQTVIGALQNAWVEGICITAQYWDWRVDADGDVTHDTPAVRLVPLGKFRFSSHADWRDVIGTSDYIIEEMNPTVRQVLDNMRPGPNGEPPMWLPMDAKEVASSCGAVKTTKDQRGEEKETVELHREARVFRVIVNRGGVDWLVYVLGESHFLTAPTKLKDVQPHGMRGYAAGGVTIESHCIVPQSKVELGEGLQAEINSITNDRRDNVALALNKRYIVKRDSGVDLAAVLRSTPGGAILTRDVDAVREVETRDVTGSSYRDEEATRAAYDEVMGSFSQTSANTNSNIGRTATGLELIASDSNIMTEYAMELFADTWMQPALRDILMLMQAYEDRPQPGQWSVLGMAAKEAGTVQTVADAILIPPEVLDRPARLRVNVGVDATNPERKVLKMRNFIQSAAELGKQINADEVLKEIAGAMGYDDGERFIQPDEEAPPAEEPPDPRIEIEGAKLEQAAQKVQMDNEVAMQRLQLDSQRIEIDMAKIQQAQEAATMRAQLDLQREQIKARMLELGIESAEEIALMQDGTTREIAGLDAETRMQQAILQGQINQAIAARRDDTDRAKAQESASVAREGFLSRQSVQSQVPDREAAR